MKLELSERRGVRLKKEEGSMLTIMQGGNRDENGEMVGQEWWEEPQVRKESKNTSVLVTNSDLGCALRAPLPSYRLLSMWFTHDGKQSL